MKPSITLSLFLILACGLVVAQQIDLTNEKQPPVSEQDAAEALADESDPQEPSAEADQTADSGETPTVDEEVAEETAEEESDCEAVSPGEGDLASEDLEETIVDTIVEQPTPPEPGLAVRVERIQGGDAAVDPSAVKLRAPFPAKLLAQVPEGWEIEKSTDAPAFTRDVELAPGSSITLSVQPHVLIPDADGASVFAVDEPGYAADLGYRQNATVGAILATSISQLEEDSRQLGTAIDQLQQLLVSLPQPETASQENPNNNPKR